MKRLIALLLCFIVASPVFAKNETDKNEFSITYGQITVPQAAYVLGGVFGAMFSLGHFSFESGISLSRMRISSGVWVWSMCIMSMTGWASAGRSCAIM